MSHGSAVHAQRATLLSVDDWAALPEDEPGELVDGRLEEEEVADLVHETVVSWLIGVLRAWMIGRGGYVFGSDVKYGMSEKRGRKPDVTVHFPGGARLPRRGPVRVAPQIAVEVLSPTPRDGRRDRVDKPDEYAAFGILYYWIIDPEERTLEFFELGPDGRYVRALGAAEGTIAPPGCEGLSLDLDSLWAEVDRLSDD